MKSTTLPQDKCPVCKTDLDMASPVDGESVPGPNDLTVCIQCGAWNKYNEDMKITTLTQEERDNMDPVLQKQMDEVSAKITDIKTKLN